ncbi:MAG: DUF4351 domain-containing protein [Chthonomonadaceae bacterium]|nr:DUF4351 domain-containing protein [Chthonomonadaceae bacterium]
MFPNHDRLFKQLISTFFIEFIELFLPQVREYLDGEVEIVPLDKEIFTDITSGDKHEVDLLMKVKFRGQDAYFLIHVENQASAQSDFPRRMFHYFARLHEKYGLPIYPVVIFSFDTPLRREPQQYEVAFPDRSVLQFQYRVIQLNQLSWRKFVNTPNPVACALMAKMKMKPEERPKVKLECLRLLATLRLDPAKTKLIGGFVESYLTLTAEELKRFERDLEKLVPQEKESAMEVLTYWEKKGLEEGLQRGKEELVFRQMQRRIGAFSSETQKRLEALTSDQLNDLGEALLDFTSKEDLENWFLGIKAQ